MRLVRTGAAVAAGRVEMCRSGEWTSVCATQNWQDQNAQVVCRQLGFKNVSGLFLIVSLNEQVKSYWASEASPTLGCSIEISRDICRYVCRYVGLSTKKICMQKAWAELRGPTTRMLKVGFWAFTTDL